MDLTFSMPLLWALEFANPGLLAGMAAASIPIVIHLLNRRKFREMRWAAMQFLLAAIRKNQRRIRIEQWLLLAIRTLLILLVVLAMAKPFLEAFGNVIAGGRTHRVLVVDNSLSMGYTTAGASRFEDAKKVAAQIVRDSRPGDAVSLIKMAPPKVVVGDPSSNLREVQKEIQDLTLSHGATDLLGTFQKIDQVLDEPSIPQKEVIFLSDLQETSWRRRDPSGKDGLDRILARIAAHRPRSVIVEVGDAGSQNRAVTDLRVEAPVVTAGSIVMVRGVVRNFGPARAEGVSVRLNVDGVQGPEQAIDLPVNEDVPVIFNYQFGTAADHVVELKMESDQLPIDDRRVMVVPVKESLNVLLVDGQYKSEPFQSETDYLAEALSPTEGSPGQPGMIRTEVVPESQLGHRELTKFDVVVLCNVAQFRPDDAAQMEEFLKQGGGLVVFGGDQVMADNYNRLLYAEGKGILPAEIGPSVGDATKKGAKFGFNPLGYRHPIIAEYRGESDQVTAGLTLALVWQYHKLKIPPDSIAQRALDFDTGDPAVIEAPHGRGKVIVVATSADAAWTTWPLHNSYPPIMQQMVLQAASGHLAERNIRVGQPFDQSFELASGTTPASVINPGGQVVPARLTPTTNGSQLHFEQTELAGRYQIQVGPPLSREFPFAATPDPAESNLARIDRTALQERLPGFSFAHLTNWRELSRSATSVGRRGELHRPLLYGAICLLLLESFLAWKFGHHDTHS